MLDNPYTRAIMWCLAPAMGLVLLAVAVQALAIGAGTQMWSGVVTLLVGAVVGQVGIVACAFGIFRRATLGPVKAARETAGLLAGLRWVLVGALVVTVLWRATISWSKGLTALLFALVAAQGWFALNAARREIATSVEA